MTKNNFWYFNEHDVNTMEICSRDEADYVSIELYNELLRAHEELLQENLELIDIIEDSGVDVGEILEAKQSTISNNT